MKSLQIWNSAIFKILHYVTLICATELFANFEKQYQMSSRLLIIFTQLHTPEDNKALPKYVGYMKDFIINLTLCGWFVITSKVTST